MNIKIEPTTFNVSYKRLSRAIQSIAIFYYQWQQPEYIEKGGSYENNVWNLKSNYKTKNMYFQN